MTEGSSREQLFSTLLRYQLSASSSYILGKPVMIKFILENFSDENIRILTWYTPLEGLKGKIFKVTCDGKEIPYEGRMIKRGNPTLDDYINVVPKGSVSAEVDLSSAYNLSICNECRVEFKGRIHDIISGEAPIPQERDEQRWIDIPGNSVVFQIVSS